MASPTAPPSYQHASQQHHRVGQRADGLNLLSLQNLGRAGEGDGARENGELDAAESLLDVKIIQCVSNVFLARSIAIYHLCYLVCLHRHKIIIIIVLDIFAIIALLVVLLDYIIFLFSWSLRPFFMSTKALLLFLKYMTSMVVSSITQRRFSTMF